MNNVNKFTKIELEPGGFATGYVRGLTDALQCAQRLIAAHRRKLKPSQPEPPLPTPSYVIVIRRAGTAVLLAVLALCLQACALSRPQPADRAIANPLSRLSAPSPRRLACATSHTFCGPIHNGMNTRILRFNSRTAGGISVAPPATFPERARPGRSNSR